MKHSTLNWQALLQRVLFPGMVALSVAGIANADEDSHSARSGAVYTSTNAAAGNEIAIYRRAADGTLTPAGRVATQGLGSGGGLGNQGALAISKNDHWLFAVNAGSNEISSFAIGNAGLTFVGKQASGGTQPVSLTVHGHRLFVLNAGGTNNITGFTVSDAGKLTPIPNSTRALSAPSTGPAQIEFSPDGESLIVTEKATNRIDLYNVEDGVVSNAFVSTSQGITPFGFAFDKRGRLIVSEAFGGGVNQSALSSYDVHDDDAALHVISASVGDKQTAACWVVVTKNGRYAYTTNTGSGSISGYRIARDGKLSLLNADGRTAITGAGPTDAAISGDGRFLYALSVGAGAVNGFRIGADGSLQPVNTAGGLPAGATGLVAR